MPEQIKDMLAQIASTAHLIPLEKALLEAFNLGRLDAMDEAEAENRLVHEAVEQDHSERLELSTDLMAMMVMHSASMTGLRLNLASLEGLMQRYEVTKRLEGENVLIYSLKEI